MRLVVDLQSAQSSSRLGGIGRYSLDLLKSMVEEKRDHDVVVVLNSGFEETTNYIRDSLRNHIPATDILRFDTPSGSAYNQLNFDLVDAAEVLRERFIRDLAPDAVHLTSLVEGLSEDIVTSVGRIPGPPVAVTLYDLIPLKQRETYLGNVTSRAHYFRKIRDLRRAQGLLAISGYSADEMREVFPDYTGIIENIKGGIDPRFRKMANARALAEKSDLFKGIKKEYILYTASFDARKNQRALIEAYARISPKLRARYSLVLAGGVWPEKQYELTKFARECGIPDGSVIFTGRVSDADLVLLYNLCALFVFPSMWEGLGLPVLEALACGAPVLCSDTTSLPEVLGCDAGLFDPGNVAEMAIRIERVLTSPDFASQLRQHVDDHLPEFTWRRVAQRAWGAIEQMAAVTSTVPALATRGIEEDLAVHAHLEVLKASELDDLFCSIAVNELRLGIDEADVERRIGWISTWGTRCGIAEYSRKYLSFLPFKPVVLAPYALLADDTRAGNVVRCWQEGKDDDLLQLADQISQLDLTDIFIQFNYGFFDFSALRDVMSSAMDAGRRVFLTLHSTLDQDAGETKKLAHLRPVLARAAGIFVHSPFDVRRLAALGLMSNVYLLAEGADPRLVQPVRSSRRPGGRAVASYGFALPGKGLEELLAATKIAKDAGMPFFLKLLNADYGDAGGVSAGVLAKLKEEVSQLGLDDLVEIDGAYKDDLDAVAALGEADLIVFPYQRTGESSSGAVRMGLLSQRPVAVTPLPIFGDVMDCVHPLDGTKPSEIAAGIERIFRQQAEDAPDFLHREAAAARWSKVNDLRGVTKVIANFMKVMALAESWSSLLAPRLAALPLTNAVLDGDVIRASGEGGVICYGPYTQIPAGLVRLRISADVKPGNGGVTVRVLAEGGRTLLGEFTIDACQPNEPIAVNLAMTRPWGAVEVVFTCEKGKSFTLHGYEFLRRLPY